MVSTLLVMIKETHGLLETTPSWMLHAVLWFSELNSSWKHADEAGGSWVWVQNPVLLLVRKIFVCRPIDTPDLEVDTRKSEFWCVEIEIWRVDRADTAEIVCVPDTPCPAKDCIFRCVAIFRRNYFSCGHGVFTLRLSLMRHTNLPITPGSLAILIFTKNMMPSS